MRTPRATFIGAVVLLIGSGSVWFWQQREITDLREQQTRLQQQIEKLATANAEAAKALTAAEKAIAVAKTELAASTPRNPAGASPAVGSSVAGAAPSPSPTFNPAPAAANASTRAPSTINTPEYRARQHARYDAFYQERGLTDAQVERLIDLGAAQDEARADLQAAVQQQGLTPGREVEAIRSKLYAPILQEVRQILGPEGYEAYKAYSLSSYYQAGTIAPLAPHFAAAGAPLSAQQQQQLARLVAQHDHPVKQRATDLGSVSQIDWSSVARDATTILSPAQLAVIQARAGKK